MSNQISQNKGPQKMGHMGMQKPDNNNDTTMSIGDTGNGPMSPSNIKQFADPNSPTGNDVLTMGSPFMSENDSLKGYTNKFMENNKKKNMNNNDMNNIDMNNNFSDNISDNFSDNTMQNIDQFSYMNYNTETSKKNDILTQDMNKTDLMGYDNLFSNFDNYGNNRDISMVNTDMINTFQNRFIKESNNKLEQDIDATGMSNTTKINGVNLNNLDSLHSIN